MLLRFRSDDCFVHSLYQLILNFFILKTSWVASEACIVSLSIWTLRCHPINLKLLAKSEQILNLYTLQNSFFSAVTSSINTELEATHDHAINRPAALHILYHTFFPHQRWSLPHLFIGVSHLIHKEPVWVQAFILTNQKPHLSLMNASTVSPAWLDWNRASMLAFLWIKWILFLISSHFLKMLSVNNIRPTGTKN